MRNVVKAKYDVGAVRLRREIVREQRVPVVDDENDRTLHLVRPQQRSDGPVPFFLIGSLLKPRTALVAVQTLRLATTDE